MFKAYLGLFSVLLLISGVLGERDEAFNFKFQQSDYKLEFERIELVRYTTHDVKFDVRTFKYNRTCAVVNMTFKYNFYIGNDLEVIAQAYKFASNEYRLFPIRLEINFCAAVKNNIVGLGNFDKCGNFTGCPLRKGIGYRYCNWAPDESQFPPFIPSGRYMLELQGLYHSKELWVLRGYGIISRPIVKK